MAMRSIYAKKTCEKVEEILGKGITQQKKSAKRGRKNVADFWDNQP